MERRILIVGTVPYNPMSSSRAFESYFSGMQKQNLAQIFSNTKVPAKGHCGTLFQITDQRMLKRMFNKRIITGKVFVDKELPDKWEDNSLEVGSSFFSKLYRIGSNKSPLIYLLRRILWRKRYWHTEQLDRWLDDFAPECVFLSFSDDFFIPQIALYAAERFNIPIVSSIGDDYYFNTRFSLSPLYHIYKSSYRRLIRRVFEHGGRAIYISDKIRNKYNSEFNLKGETVYLTSEFPRKPFEAFCGDKPKIAYFGNVGMGRAQSLCDIAESLGRICGDIKLEVYTNQNDKKAIKTFSGNKNIRLCGSVPYSTVVQKALECDIFVIVEGFKPKDVNLSRYSLSTKAADALKSGCHIFVYGSDECGVVEYMRSTDSAFVCSNKAELDECISSMLSDVAKQKQYYENAIKITEKHHSIVRSTDVFRNVVEEAVAEYDKEQ